MERMERREGATRAYRGRVLVVDDDPSTRRGATIRLSASGYDVVTARSAGEGFYKARRERPDTILLDLGLPDADGLDLLAEIRKTPACRSCPVIVTTSRDPREAKLSCLSGGAQSFLQKPVENGRLLQEIARWMGHGDVGPHSSRTGGRGARRGAGASGTSPC